MEGAEQQNEENYRDESSREISQHDTNCAGEYSKAASGQIDAQKQPKPTKTVNI